ncbi:MAG: GNAT family N-acetyltransferase [Maritimibacter sp.]|nr:GNAT family N-acetyltransferase [Maritimibacter sp.]
MIRWRDGRRGDVAAVVAMLADDALGRGREAADLVAYEAGFDAMTAEAGNHLIVGEDADGAVVACYQITFISGLSLAAARRAQIEGVRVRADRRGQGIGAALIADAEARARAVGCSLVQLTSNAARADARRFYEAQGFAASHVGFKKVLGAEQR